MEQPKNNIDDLLRARLEHAAVPPPAFVWPNVERALRRRRRRAALWLLAAGLAGVGMAAVWSRHGTAPDAQAPSAPWHTPTVAAPEAALPNHVPSAPEAAVAVIPGSAMPATAAERPSATRPAPMRTAPASAAAPGHPARQASSTPDARQAAPATGATPKDPLPAQAPQAEAPAVRAAEAPELTEIAPENSAALPVAEYLPGRLAALDEPGRTLALNPIQLPEIKKRAPRKCYDFHSNRQAWLLDAYIGPSFVHKSLSTDDPEFRDYVADRQSTEDLQNAFHGGIRASYLFAENFILRTGLHYDQFTEKFEYIDPNYIKYTVEITQKFINGQWVSTLDTIGFEYGSNYVKTYNRFGLLDIPLQAALELRSGITGVSLNLGGSVNVLFWKRGSMLAPDGNPVSFTPGKHQYEVFRPHLSLSLLGSIQWFLHVGPKTRVFAEPYYRYLLEPVSRAGYPLKQSYGVGGIRLGVTRIVDVK